MKWKAIAIKLIEVLEKLHNVAERRLAFEEAREKRISFNQRYNPENPTRKPQKHSRRR